MLNFRFGYRLAEADGDGWLYGGFAACADAFKGMLPFLMMIAWRNGHRLATVVGGIMFALFTLFSLTAEIGLAAQIRDQRTSLRSVGAERYADLRSEMTRLQTSLAALGTQRPSKAIEEERRAILATPVGESRKTVADVSLSCSFVRKETRDQCQQWSNLGVELETARQAESYAASISVIRQKRCKHRRRRTESGSPGGRHQPGGDMGICGFSRGRHSNGAVHPRRPRARSRQRFWPVHGDNAPAGLRRP